MPDPRLLDSNMGAKNMKMGQVWASIGVALVWNYFSWEWLVGETVFDVHCMADGMAPVF